MSVRLDRYIRIETEQETGRDPVYDQAIIAWVPLASVWANVRDILPGSNVETQRFGLELAKNPVVVRIRYRKDVSGKMRIVELGGRQRTMVVVAGPAEVQATGRERYVDIGCDVQV
jgi:SPP1 family predicted phage head-tail adaptor